MTHSRTLQRDAGVSRIHLLRHGEPIGGRRYRGQIDDPLSERGWEQMWDAVRGRGPWHKIVTSPLQRCSAFAHALAREQQIPVRQDERLKEVGFGVWEGRDSRELRSEDPHQLRRFYRDPVNARPSGAEPLETFVERVRQAFTEIISGIPGESVLVVTHAGVIRAIVAQVLLVPDAGLYRMSIPAAGMLQVQFDQERPPTLLFP